MRRLVNTILFFYLLATIVTAFLLIRLPNDLVQKAQVVNPEEIGNAQGVFNLLYLVVGVTSILGLLAVYLLLRSFSAYKLKSTLENQKELADTTVSDQSKKQQNENAISESLGLGNLESTLKKQKTDNLKLDAALNFACKELKASQGTIYKAKQKGSKRVIELVGSYAYTLADSETLNFEFGEGLVGQVAKSGQIMNLQSIPKGYTKIFSGLGNSTPDHLIILPVKLKEKIIAVAEIASFKEITQSEEKFLIATFDYLASMIGKTSSKKTKTKTEDAQ